MYTTERHEVRVAGLAGRRNGWISAEAAVLDVALEEGSITARAFFSLGGSFEISGAARLPLAICGSIPPRATAATSTAAKAPAPSANVVRRALRRVALRRARRPSRPIAPRRMGSSTKRQERLAT